MKNDTSFIFGENPTEVPIYAVVNMCSNVEDLSFKNGNVCEFYMHLHDY